MKRFFKWLGVAILTPILLFLLLAVLLYLPPVQNWAVKQVAAIAQEKTGLEISVGHVRLEFPLNLGVDDVRVLQPNDSLPHLKDTVADIGRMVVNVQLKPLFRKQVEIDELELNRLKFNTTHFIPSARVKGQAQRVYLESHGIDLREEFLRVNTAKLEGADVLVELNDTVPPDTTESKNFWKIRVDELTVNDSRVKVHMPGDSLRLGTYLGKTTARNGYFDLFQGEYRVERLDLMEGQLSYDNRFVPKSDGVDYNHLDLFDISLGVDTFSYKSPQLAMSIRNCSFKEKSGLTVNDLSGPVALDSAKVSLPALSFRTPESELNAIVKMDFNAFSDSVPGTFDVVADGVFGKQDLMRFMGRMPQGFVRQWPNQPLTVKAVAKGNMQHLDIAGLNVLLPGALRLNANGTVENLDDTDRMKADLYVDATAHNINFLTALLPSGTMNGIRIPAGIGVKGKVKADGSIYGMNVVATEGKGQVKAKGQFDSRKMAYTAQVDARNLQLSHFLPGQGLGNFTGTADIDGVGTDVLSPKTRLKAKAKIEKFTYGQYNLDGMMADATVANGHIKALVDSNNPLLKGAIKLDALTNTRNVSATIGADITHADLYQLKIADEPFTISGCGHFDISTDTKDFYQVQGMASDLVITSRNEIYRPDDMVVDVLTSRDTTHAVVDCGDFHLNMNAGEGYKQLADRAERLAVEMNRQMKERRIDQMALRRIFPSANIHLTSGQSNMFSRMLARMGYTFQSADIHMNTSAAEGLNGRMQLYTLMVDSVQLDTVRLDFASDSTNITFHGQVRNNTKNPQFVFNTLFDGYMLERGAGINLRYYDDKERLGIRLGAEALMEEHGIRLHMLSDDAILAYRSARINDDNYVFLADNKRVSANLEILGEDGTGIKVYSNDDNPDVLQDLTVSLGKLNLEELTSVLPYMPRVTGLVDGDFHFVQDTEHISVSSAMTIDDMTYEGNKMGDLGADFVYIPLENGAHMVDGILSVDRTEVGSVTGTYHSANGGSLDATLTLSRLPMSLANGFIPDQIVGLKGYGEGELTVKGPLNKPRVNGEVFLDSCHLVSVPYGIDLRFSNDPVRIVGSHLLLENFEMYAYNENPLNMAGNIDFSDFDNVNMNVRMRGDNIEIIRAKENPKSVAYGRAFVNFVGMMQGPLANLSLRGKLDVLGSTDLNYVLRDSPLTTDIQLDELVKFVDLNDTTEAIVNRPPLTGFSMDLTMSVDQGAHVMAYLNADHSNYIDLMGGGNLRMQYDVVNDLRLRGRYTLANGQMKYSLPVIPLKTFTIQDGSYIEFTGDVMNPTLHITATERTKATVTGTNGVGRGVDFDCGVIITQTLNNMGLEFILSAPEDMALAGELQQMSKEQRGKLAVTMLTTGMYLADGNTSGFSMNSALSSYLESEINNITGNALQSIGLSMNLDNATDATGNMHTDYNFKFARRFWNNRLNISIGGKVSTGAQEAMGQNASFFDNATMEYRLDNTANKYVKLFFNNNSYDWLEGYTQEYGAGFIWRRTLQHFRDIFRLRNDENLMPQPPKLPQPPRDSIIIDVPEDNSGDKTE